MDKKISKKTLSAAFFIGLAGNIAWAVENQYFNVFLYNAISPEPIYVALMVAASAIVATITTIIMGAYSDIKGKRKPFMIAGFIFWTITTAIFPLAGLFQPIILAVVIAIVFDCVMTFFGSTAFDASFQAYITDITTMENRGKVVSIVIVITMEIATLITYGISGFVIESFGYYMYFYVVAFMVGIFGIPFALLLKDPPNLKPLDTNVYKQIKSTFKKENFKKYKNFFLVLTSSALTGLAFNVFFPFALIYMQHYLGFGLEMASIVLFFAFFVDLVAAYPIGILTDKIGRKKLTFSSIIFVSVFLFIFAFVVDFFLLIIVAMIMMLFMTIFSIAAITWTKDLYPEEKFGQFSGYVILFNVAFTMVPGPLIGGWLATTYGIPTIINGQPGFIPTPIIIIVASLLMLLALIPLYFAKEKRKEVSNEL